jgi:hypothetical protein
MFGVLKFQKYVRQNRWKKTNATCFEKCRPVTRAHWPPFQSLEETSTQHFKKLPCTGKPVPQFLRDLGLVMLYHFSRSINRGFQRSISCHRISKTCGGNSSSGSNTKIVFSEQGAVLALGEIRLFVHRLGDPSCEATRLLVIYNRNIFRSVLLNQ